MNKRNYLLIFFSTLILSCDKFQGYKIPTSSMLPNFPIGEVLAYDKKFKLEELKRFDVIFYKSPKEDTINFIWIGNLKNKKLLKTLNNEQKQYSYPQPTKDYPDNYIVAKDGNEKIILLGQDVLSKYSNEINQNFIIKKISKLEGYQDQSTEKFGARTFISRLIGFPGDIIEIKKGQLIINKIIIIRNFLFNTNIYGFNKKVYEISYEGRKFHQLYSNPKSTLKLNKKHWPFNPNFFRGAFENFGPITVPKNEYFFLGDNINQSFDSRYIGTTPFNHIKGKLFDTYWK